MMKTATILTASQLCAHTEGSALLASPGRSRPYPRTFWGGVVVGERRSSPFLFSEQFSYDRRPSPLGWPPVSFCNHNLQSQDGLTAPPHDATVMRLNLNLI